MFRKRLFSILLTLILLISTLGGSFSVAAADNAAGSASPGDINVLYIPLDNRPFNNSEVCSYAESVGIHLIMPDEALFATTLDGQTSITGMQSGDRAALLEWLMSHAGEADIIVLSLDQLLSGGLMNSRVLESTSSLTLSDGTEMTEYDIIDYLASLAADHELYLIDSVLRLASSFGYAGYTLRDYYATRAYGKVVRPVLTGDELTMENVFAAYQLAADGSDALYQAGLSDASIEYLLGSADTESDTSDSRLQRYLNIRQRKLRLNAYAIEKLAGLENTHYYLGIDDSSSGDTLHTNELNYLLQLANGNVTVIDALDGIAQQLLTQLLSSQLQAALPTAQVLWYGDSADNNQSYSRINIRQSLSLTAGQLGVTLTDAEADLSILVLTSCSGTARADAAVYQLAGQINQNEAAGIPTILLFYTNCTASQKQILADNCHLGTLLAVAGNYQPSNATIGISVGVGRYLMLTAGSLTQQRNQAYIETLAESLTYVYYDTSSQEREMSTQIASLGLDSSNFGDLSEETTLELNASLTQEVSEAAAAALSSIAGSNYLVSLSPLETAGIESVSLASACYPWNRTSEVEYSLTAQLSSETTDSGTYHSAFANGATATTFEPGAKATREQLIVLLTRASGITLSATADRSFSDVSEFAAAAVQTAVENGFVHGYDDGTFRGSSPMTRAEFSTLLINYMQYAGYDLSPTREMSFTDVPAQGAWYSSNIYLLANAGYINGYSDGTFRPDQTITRGEAVALLCQIFGRTEELTGSLATVPHFTDVSTDYWAFRYIQEASVSHFCTG